MRRRGWNYITYGAVQVQNRTEEIVLDTVRSHCPPPKPIQRPVKMGWKEFVKMFILHTQIPIGFCVNLSVWVSGLSVMQCKRTITVNN